MGEEASQPNDDEHFQRRLRQLRQKDGWVIPSTQHDISFFLSSTGSTKLVGIRAVGMSGQLNLLPVDQSGEPFLIVMVGPALSAGRGVVNRVWTIQMRRWC